MTLAAAGKSVECCVAGTGMSPLGSGSYLNFTEPWKVGLKAPFKHKAPSTGECLPWLSLLQRPYRLT